MKKFLTLVLAILMISSCVAFATSAAAPDELVIDMANDLKVLPGRESGEGNEIKVAGANTAYASLEDGKIVFRANSDANKEEYPRAIIQFNKQIAAATYKWMVVEIKHGDATLSHYQNGATTEFTPHVQVGYVKSDITTLPTKWVSIGSNTGALLTTPETFTEDFVNKTFDISAIKEQTITMLIQLPDAAADGYSDYINTLYWQPYGWAAGVKNESSVEITSIKFYSANPYDVEDEGDAGDAGDVGDAGNVDDENDQGSNNTTNNTTATETKSSETTAPATTETNEKSGCGSVIGGSALAIAAIAGTVILTKKKKED